MSGSALGRRHVGHSRPAGRPPRQQSRGTDLLPTNPREEPRIPVGGERWSSGVRSNGVDVHNTPIAQSAALIRINLSCRIPAREREAGGATRPTSAVSFFTNSFSRNGAAGAAGRRHPPDVGG